MVRRSEGCSWGERGFNTHLFWMLSIPAMGAAESGKDEGSDEGEQGVEL